MRWMWIDRIVELVPGERLVAIKHVGLAEEHLRDHFPEDAELGLPETPVMPAPFIIEGMAQAAGTLVGHVGGFKEKVILAKVSRAEFDRDATPGCTLRYTATIERYDALGASTKGIVELIDPGKAGDLPNVDRTGQPLPGWASPMENTTKPPVFETIGRIDLLFSHIDNNMAGLEFPSHNFVFSGSFHTLLRTSGLEAEAGA